MYWQGQQQYCQQEQALSNDVMFYDDLRTVGMIDFYSFFNVGLMRCSCEISQVSYVYTTKCNEDVANVQAPVEYRLPTEVDDMWQMT